MSSKFFLHQGKNKKAEQGRPWIYIDEINEYDGDYENGDINSSLEKLNKTVELNPYDVEAYKVMSQGFTCFFQ